MELILYTARSAQYRPQLAERLRARRALIARIVEETTRSAPFLSAVDPEEVAAMLLALEDGYRLHRLIDPASTPADSFLTVVGRLQELVRQAAAASGG
jgi:hypothetical protein